MYGPFDSKLCFLDGLIFLLKLTWFMLNRLSFLVLRKDIKLIQIKLTRSLYLVKSTWFYGTRKTNSLLMDAQNRLSFCNTQSIGLWFNIVTKKSIGFLN